MSRHLHRRTSPFQFGEFTAGLNLLSSAVLRFRPCDAKGQPSGTALDTVDVVLRPRTLYVMHGALRWEHTHEVLPREESDAVWGARQHEELAEEGALERGRRLSVIVRDRSAAAGFAGDIYFG